MCAEFEAGFDVPLLLERLERSRRVGPMGEIHFSASFTEYVAVLRSAVKLHSSIPEQEKLGLINGALFSMSAHLPMEAGKLRKEISRREKVYLEKPLESYVLVTNLSVEYFEKMPSVRSEDSVISFSARLSPRFARSQGAVRQIDVEFPKSPPASLWAQVHVKARSSEEAAESALNRLDFMRAIWNLFFLHGSLRTSSGRASPLSDIVAGPVHTIHFPDGRLAVEGFWFEPNYMRSQSAKQLAEHWPEVKRFENEVRRDLKKILYQDMIRDALRRYVRALDMSDWDAAMLKLWSVLEGLTDTVRLPYDRTIKRASFIYSEEAYNVQVLRHLREYRNRTVHADFSRRDREIMLCQVKNYVGDLLLFHLRVGKQFKSLEELGRFLDSPANEEVLRRNLGVMRKALDFRERWLTPRAKDQSPV